MAAALQTIPEMGHSALRLQQSQQPVPPISFATAIIHDCTTVALPFLLALDDYHMIKTVAIHEALIYLLEHLPLQMHLLLTTRADPPFPLARWRARHQINELREVDLRFSVEEAMVFLCQAMQLDVSKAEAAVLQNRTEGWVAGLQLAALSLHGLPQDEAQADFITNFAGDDRFVMDYMVAEVLDQQDEVVSTFLLQTAILDCFYADLCGPILENGDSIRSQQILERLDAAHLFITPLDNKQAWYRYHHLFAELLRQRLQQSQPPSVPPMRGMKGGLVAELHIRASQWYEDNGLPIEAFHHAAAANDVERAGRLIEGNGIPLHLRGAVMTILNWLASLPTAVLNARPWLWWRYGSLLLVSGHTTGVAEKLQAAEDALLSTEMDERLGDKTRNFVGRIATARAVLALTQYKVETMLVQSRRALEYLDADNLSTRANANWTLGYAYFLQGDHGAAHRAYIEAIALGEEEEALQRLSEALALAEPGGFVRTFVDEGFPMAQLLRTAAACGIVADYTNKLLAIFDADVQLYTAKAPTFTQSPQTMSASLAEPLSERELEVLHLIATGKKTQEIADQLIISLNTVRYHTKNLFGKLGVNKRTHWVGC